MCDCKISVNLEKLIEDVYIDYKKSLIKIKELEQINKELTENNDMLRQSLNQINAKNENFVVRF